MEFLKLILISLTLSTITLIHTRCLSFPTRPLILPRILSDLHECGSPNESQPLSFSVSLKTKAMSGFVDWFFSLMMDCRYHTLRFLVYLQSGPDLNTAFNKSVSLVNGQRVEARQARAIDRLYHLFRPSFR